MWEYKRYYFDNVMYEINNNLLEINDSSARIISYVDLSKHIDTSFTIRKKMIYVDLHHIYVYFKESSDNYKEINRFVLVINKKSNTDNHVFIKKILVSDINRIIIMKDFIYNFHSTGIFTYDKVNFELLNFKPITEYNFAINAEYILIFQKNSIIDKLPILDIKLYLEEKMKVCTKSYKYKIYLDRYEQIFERKKELHYTDDIDRLSKYRNKLYKFRDKLNVLNIKSNPITWSKYELRDHYANLNFKLFAKAIIEFNVNGADLFDMTPTDIKIILKNNSTVCPKLLQEIVRLNNRNKITKGCCIVCGSGNQTHFCKNCMVKTTCDNCKCDKCPICSLNNTIIKIYTV